MIESVKSVMPTIYEPAAIYQSDSDCIEYIRQDGGVYYHRVDDFLTLIKTIDGKNTVGFKLKGFKYLLQNNPNAIQLNDEQFSLVVKIFEVVFSVMGESLVHDPEVRQAYDEAVEIAANDNVRFEDSLKNILNAA